MRGPDSWTGPNGLTARFGRDATAHGEWFYGFRLAVRTDLGSRVVRAWAIVPAAINERDLVPGRRRRPGRAADRQGLQRPQFAASLAAQGISVLVPPTGAAPDHVAGLLKVIAEWRNRIETTFGEITDQMELARHGAHTFWGLLTRTASTIAAHTSAGSWPRPLSELTQRASGVSCRCTHEGWGLPLRAGSCSLDVRGRVNELGGGRSVFGLPPSCRGGRGRRRPVSPRGR